jgi:GNAT superfamily N-acetyltransferase
MNIRIEQAVNLDRCDEFSQVYDHYWRENSPDEESAADTAAVAFKNYLASPDKYRSFFLIDGDTNAIVGFANIHINVEFCSYEHAVYVADLYVAPEYRYYGLATRMINHLVELCQQNNWKKLYWVTVLENAEVEGICTRLAKRRTHVWYEIPVLYQDPIDE